mgnify:CR=1 FL=1
METLLELINRLSFLAAMPAVFGLFIALGMILVTRRWQIEVLALVLLYFFVGLLHSRIIRPEVALVKALIGWLLCLTLYVTGRYLDERSGKRRPRMQEERLRWLPPLAADTPLRILVLLVVVVIAYLGSVYLPLPQVAGHVGLACYLLAAGGLLLVGISEEPLRVGIGLLLFLSGFDLFFGALEPSLVVAGLFGASNFLIALAVIFLAVTHAAAQEESA